VIVVSLVVGATSVIIAMSLSIPFPFWVAAEQKASSVEVNISLAFLHWVGIALHPCAEKRR